MSEGKKPQYWGRKQIWIDENIHADVKAFAARKVTSVQDMTEKALVEYMNRNGPSVIKNTPGYCGGAVNITLTDEQYKALLENANPFAPGGTGD